MLAVGRALMSQPQVLLLDEPSLGLSPLMCKELFATLGRVKELGVGVLLVEQNAALSLGVGSRGYLLANGRIVGAGAATDLQSDPAVRRAYLGGGVGSGNGHVAPNGAAPQTARLGNSGVDHARENSAQAPARQTMPRAATAAPPTTNSQRSSGSEPVFQVDLLINNADVKATGGATFERLNPLTGEVASRAAAATPQDAIRAVEAAAAAFPAWSAVGPGARRAILNKAADLLAS
jgi:ABC-type sulfate/molybdate transport systems ATPase subunit